ncbi:hypothetical protein [Microbaculum marinum]|uniref:Uncharacterized protein n=1 Tax=Microbaculum marinum TaxID=1764581 RepID=A0AAW9RY21_9HYPH
MIGNSEKNFFRRGAAGLLSGLLMGSAVLAGAPAAASADVFDSDDREPVPVMIIKIFNNSPDHNIYPVLSTGTSTTDSWLQSAFKIKKADFPDYPFPKPNQFRFYINPNGDGIPPKGKVTIRLPLYTQLVPDHLVDPKKPDQFIDWWGGGRIEIFDAPAETGRPPRALREAYRNRMGQVEVDPIADAAVPTCTGCQPFKFFKDAAGLKHNEPSQLTEYTLGALNFDTDPYSMNLENVDFDVSYVDDAYLPVAMEPFGNKQVGYVGMVNSIQKFRAALNKFLAKDSPYYGWPQFVDQFGDKILKVPSTLHVYGAGPNTPDLTPAPWAPITALNKDWDSCLDKSDKSKYCIRLRKIRRMFQDNYDNYIKNYITPFGCDPKLGPVELDEELMRTHVQGWTPFNQFCGKADINLLADTPGYTANNSRKYHNLKGIFDKLQYLKSGRFNPYSKLIHSKKYIGAPNVYAYSVDDAVGNMQAEGTGLIIAVGGKRGLPNKNPATPPIHVSFGYAPTDLVRFTHYGVCTTVPDHDVNPSYASFDVSITSIGDCHLTFLDNFNRTYTFDIKSQPPYPTDNKRTPATHAEIDCSRNTEQYAKDWCEGVFAYTLVGKFETTNYVIAPAPQQVR